MASSRNTSNGPDWQDLTQAIANYEHFNGCVISVELLLLKRPKALDLSVTAVASRKSTETGDQVRLVSASVSCRQSGYAGLESAVMKSLYDLDVAMWAAEPPEIPHG